MSQPANLPFRHAVIIEPVTAAPCPQGVRTFVELTPALARVIERLEYGAAKHAGEPWKRQSFGEHIEALDGHVEGLSTSRAQRDRLGMIADPNVEGIHINGEFVPREKIVADAECRARDARKHLAAIACRALMALTLEAEEPHDAIGTILGERAQGLRYR